MGLAEADPEAVPKLGIRRFGVGWLRA
jgi:hypothetical protein